MARQAKPSQQAANVYCTHVIASFPAGLCCGFAHRTHCYNAWTGALPQLNRPATASHITHTRNATRMQAQAKRLVLACWPVAKLPVRLAGWLATNLACVSPFYGRQCVFVFCVVTVAAAAARQVEGSVVKWCIVCSCMLAQACRVAAQLLR